MQHLPPARREHPAEPAPGTLLTAVGADADLFDVTHYPVRARCRICREPIRAESFLRAFEHDDADE
ncbi:MAG TPA: hypothetical protein VH021_14025 [Trebonia sp.]|nr:hypothetical protein [Trebonia sp.]